MENNITYEQYCEKCQQYIDKLDKVPFDKKHKEERKIIFKEYIDFAVEYPDYYTKRVDELKENKFFEHLSVSDVSSEVNDVIKKFNERIQSGDYSTEQCYGWLMMEKNRLQCEHPGMVHDFQFLYPVRINVDNIMKNVKKTNG